METLKTLLQTIQGRQVDAPENSYTAYLFREGLDKVLKKVGEESAEVIIAAKNSDSEELINELADLQYHLLVLMAEKNISWDVLDAELARRSQKIGNKKVFHQVDKES